MSTAKAIRAWLNRDQFALVNSGYDAHAHTFFGVAERDDEPLATGSEAPRNRLWNHAAIWHRHFFGVAERDDERLAAGSDIQRC